MSKRILVVTSCTGEKYKKPKNQLIIEDFMNADSLSQREFELIEFKVEAGKMYTGSQHKSLMDGVQEYRRAGHLIDVDILSAGYGLINEHQEIVPYEVTFNSMNASKIKNWSRHQNITNSLIERIKDYDLVFFLLGDKYLQSIEWPIPSNLNQKLIFFAGESSKIRVLMGANQYVLAIGEEEARKLKFGLIGIKGFLFSKLLQQSINNENDIWEEIYKEPESIRKYILNQFESGQLELFFEESNNNKLLLTFYSEMYPVPKKLIAQNFGTEFNFFIPENDDRVDPDYNFKMDISKINRNPIVNDVYAHQIYGTPQYDGVLISKTNIDKGTAQKKQLIKNSSIRVLLDLPENYPIMGDCGAFSYITQETPPYTTEEVINYYESMGFDYGVSVDHLIVGPFQSDKVERKRRYDITLSMAREFFEKHLEGNYKFKAVGIGQGWDPSSYRDAVQELINIGYTRIALGGLARETSSKIFEILKKISPIIPNEEFRMHLFGVARDMRTMKSFNKLGVTSFDSASPLRRAWLGSGHNYHTISGKHFTAIRVPEAKETSGRIKAMVLQGRGEFSQFKKLEQEAISALRSFNDKKIDVETTLKAILNYDELLGENREAHEDLYRELLMERPWEECTCKICEKIGIEVVIFRGNNRNRRRGFHNTHVYHTQIKKLRETMFLN